MSSRNLECSSEGPGAISTIFGEDIAQICQEKDITIHKLLSLRRDNLDSIFSDFRQRKLVRDKLDSLNPVEKDEGKMGPRKFSRAKSLDSGKNNTVADQGSTDAHAFVMNVWGKKASKDAKKKHRMTQTANDTPQMDAYGPLCEKKSMAVREIRSGMPSIFKLEAATEYCLVDRGQIPIYHVGKQPDPKKQEKVILVLGATGVGKKTLIDGFVNFLFKVQWDDNFRLATFASGVLSKSQAFNCDAHISVYKFFHQPNFTVPYSITIICIPGFGNLDGPVTDGEIVLQMKDFFRSESHGIDHIDAIVLAIKASDVRVTHLEHFIFTSIKKIMNSNIEEQIMVVATHSDGSHVPALQVLKETKVPFKETQVFAVNNTALFCNNTPSGSDDDDNTALNKLLWKKNIKAISKFFKALNDMTPQKLSCISVMLGNNDYDVIIDSLKRQMCLAILPVILDKKRRQDMSESCIMLEIKVTLDNGQEAYFCKTCKWICHNPLSSGVEDVHPLPNEGCSACKPNCDEGNHVPVKHVFQYKLGMPTEIIDNDFSRPYIPKEEGLDSTETINKNIIFLLRTVNSRLKEPHDLEQFALMCTEDASQFSRGSGDLLCVKEWLTKLARKILTSPEASDDLLLVSIDSESPMVTQV
jgi:hypothetical protein